MINYKIFAETIYNGESYFSESYLESRERFLNSVLKHKAKIDSIKIDGVGSQGEDLFLDFAVIGNPNANKAVLHIAGTHGIEGYLGAAIQLGILECLETPTEQDSSVILLHSLNPWGMSHLRRVTEDNIDLNRNFLLDDTQFKGASEQYSILNKLLNPQTPPSKIDLFYLKIILAALRYGFNTVKQGVAGGQYEYKNGLFFGGKALSQNLSVFADWLKENLQGKESVFGVEVHSGLGPFGYDSLLTHLRSDNPRFFELEKILNHKLSGEDAGSSVAYHTSGDLAGTVPTITGLGKTDWILQEFGTYNPLKVLNAFRKENMYHHYRSGGKNTLDHWSKRDLFEAFNPASVRWRRLVVGRGIDIVGKILSSML